MTLDDKTQLEALEAHASECVCVVLARISRNVTPGDIRRDTSVVDDLGLDSLRFVDLTLALEEALDIEDLPLQDWFDSESVRSEKRYSVASLVALCVRSMRVRP